MQNPFSRFLVLVSLTLVLIGASGCDDCDDALGLRARLQAYEGVITNALGDHAQIATVCDLAPTWKKPLTKGAAFAEKMANKHFVVKTKVCATQGNIPVCTPDPLGQGLVPRDPTATPECTQAPGCTNWIEGYKEVDGYRQLMEVSDLVTRVKSNLASACHRFSNEENADRQLGFAKIKLSASINDTTYALKKAGCRVH
jgi:hypothetical protein